MSVDFYRTIDSNLKWGYILGYVIVDTLMRSKRWLLQLTP